MNTKQRITEDMYRALQKPLPNGAVAKHPTKNFLSTIKAIYVVERLNEVFGVGMWTLSDELVRQDSKHIVVKATMTFEEYIGTFHAYGGNDNPDLGDAYKGAVTDALTKIGSFLGVGMSVFKGEGNTEPKEAPKPQKQATPAKQENAPQAAANEPQQANVRYATAKQKEEIISLLNNPAITREEKTKMLLNVNRFDEQRASEAIEKLKTVIKGRGQTA